MEISILGKKEGKMVSVCSSCVWLFMFNSLLIILNDEQDLFTICLDF